MTSFLKANNPELYSQVGELNIMGKGKEAFQEISGVLIAQKENPRLNLTPMIEGIKNRYGVGAGERTQKTIEQGFSDLVKLADDNISQSLANKTPQEQIAI